jgi:hypothetical protein
MKLAHTLVDYILEVVDICAFTGRNKEAILFELGHPCGLELVEGKILAGFGGEVVLVFGDILVGIHFVENHHHGLVATVKVGKCLVHNLYLLLKVGVGNIHHMQQKVGLAHLVKGRLEGLYKVGGELAYESNGVGEQEGEIFYYHFAHGGVEGCKELVLGKDLALG